MLTRQEVARFADARAHVVQPTVLLNEVERDLFREAIRALMLIRTAGRQESVYDGYDDDALLTRIAACDAAIEDAMERLALFEAAGFRLTAKPTRDVGGVLVIEIRVTR